MASLERQNTTTKLSSFSFYPRYLRNWGRLHCIEPRIFLSLQHPLDRCIACTPLHFGHLLREKHEVRRARSGTTPSFCLGNVQASSVLHTVNKLPQRSVSALFQLFLLSGGMARGNGRGTGLWVRYPDSKPT